MCFCCAFQLPISITRSGQMPGIGEYVVSGAGKMVEPVQSNNLSWTPEPMVGGENGLSHVISLDLHSKLMACVRPVP